MATIIICFVILLTIRVVISLKSGWLPTDDPRRNQVIGVPTNVVGKWEGLMAIQVRRFGSELADSVWPANRDEWVTGKGFEFGPDGTLNVYSFTNSHLIKGPGSNNVSLTATGHYVFTGGVLNVQLRGESASVAFPPVTPTTTADGSPLPKQAQERMAGALYLGLTNEAQVGNVIGLRKVSKFKFE